ncbi:tetratricopeptide repeat protein [Actinacidiphila oryziradicis]|nr:tetratricopeptide repeat protein [Actinacidiphila oryziradicis]
MGLIRSMRGRKAESAPPVAAASGTSTGLPSSASRVDAEQQRLRKLQADTRAHGLHDPRTLESRALWAHSLLGLNRLEECEAEIREVVRLCARPPVGPEHKLTASARIILVTLLQMAGRFPEAEAEARDLVAVRAALPNDRPRLVASSMAALAANSQGRHTEAVAEYDSLLPDFVSSYGAEHLLTLKMRSDRAQILGYLGRHEETEAECLAIAGIADRIEGASALLLQLAARNGLAHARSRLGRHVEAETVAREAIDRDAQTSGPDNKLAVVLRITLLRSLNGQGRYDEALAEARAARAAHLRTPGGRHDEAGAIEIGTATALAGLGRGEEAEAEARRALAACESALGTGHHRTQEAQALLTTIERKNRTSE